MKQYLPLKPTNIGFKTWVIADSTNGYSLDMQVYTGREGTVTEYGLGERVVLDLTEQYRVGVGVGVGVTVSSVTTTLHRLPSSMTPPTLRLWNNSPEQERSSSRSTIHTTGTRREQILAKWTTCAGYMAGQATGTRPVHSFTAR